jgi:hypothetical protein
VHFYLKLVLLQLPWDLDPPPLLALQQPLVPLALPLLALQLLYYLPMMA